MPKRKRNQNKNHQTYYGYQPPRKRLSPWDQGFEPNSYQGPSDAIPLFPHQMGFQSGGRQNSRDCFQQEMGFQQWGNRYLQGHGNSMNFQSFEEDDVNRIVYMDPSKFLQLEPKLCFSGMPPVDQPHHGITAKRQKLSREIWSFFNNKNQSKSVFRNKIDLWMCLERVLSQRFNCTTHVFGSTLNGFGDMDSDMDVCMFVDRSDYSNMSKNQASTRDVQLLAQVRKALRHGCGNTLSGNIELIPAKVPILRFYDRQGDLEVDLSVNNPVCIRNTNLLYCYGQLDWRVKPLVLVIKAWAKAQGINEAKFQTLSSYCLALLVLHYLQSGVDPPVIPSLQSIHPELFNPDSHIFTLPFLQNVPSYSSRNGMSLGELLCGFFDYYQNDFDFARDVASTRAGCKLNISSCQSLARENKNSPGQWDAYICIEEPFDRTNAGRAICKRDKFDLILHAFSQANQMLRSGTNLKTFLSPNND